jgi:integrase
MNARMHLHGKGRKQRTVPLWRSTVKQIRAWLKLNPQLEPHSPLLPNRDGNAMTRGNVTQRLALAVKAATAVQPQLAKRRISPHTVRHTTAMHLLQSGVDITVIALWLGHESPVTTHHYVEAGVGVACVMSSHARTFLQERRVVHCYPNWQAQSKTVYVVIPKSQGGSAKVRAFTDFLSELATNERRPSSRRLVGVKPLVR